MNYLPLILLLLPLTGAVLIWARGEERPGAGMISLLVTGATVLIAGCMYKEVFIEHRTIIIGFPLFIHGLELAVDGLSFLLTFITAFIWFLSTLFAQKYMEQDARKRRYYIFSLLVLMSNLGVLMGKDLFTIFVFFELMGILSYVLIAHTETKEALQAGEKYICITILGGLTLLAGVLLYYYLAGTLDIHAPVDTQAPTTLKYLTALMLITGFGVKAGMIPLHIWLPDAHPAAPTPASAILSGVIIKSGAYGIIRVVGLPLFTASPDIFLSGMGYVIIWAGMVTMLTGVILALLQANAKRLLAYHSISQMGYILMGVGCALYLGHEGAIGIMGSVYHIINHAVFKSCLFFIAGAVYLQMHDNDLYNLGGLARKMPWLAAFTVIAACGISGIPPFNGYISKTMLHHAILESYLLKHDPLLKIAEVIFMVTGALTICSFIKFTGLTFFAAPHKSLEHVKEPPAAIHATVGILALSVLVLGLFPDFFINRFLLFTLPAQYMRSVDLSLLHLNFWDSHSLSGMILPVLGGIFAFFVGMRWGLFHLHIPPWLSIDHRYRQIALGGREMVYSGYIRYTECMDSLKRRAQETGRALAGAGYVQTDLSERFSFNNIDNLKFFYKHMWQAFDNKMCSLKHYLYLLARKTESRIMELNMQRIEWYEYAKLRGGCLILKKCIIPLVEVYYPTADIIDLKNTGRNCETLFDLKEKIDNIRALYYGDTRYSSLETESILEEKFQGILRQRAIYNDAARRMLQYYTSDISLGLFLIIVIIAVYFLWILFML